MESKIAKLQKAEKWVMRFFIAIGLFTVVFNSCESFYKSVNEFTGFKIYPDNLAEEIAEEYIDHKTGLDIDLTPSTPE